MVSNGLVQVLPRQKRRNEHTGANTPQEGNRTSEKGKIVSVSKEENHDFLLTIENADHSFDIVGPFGCSRGQFLHLGDVETNVRGFVRPRAVGMKVNLVGVVPAAQEYCHHWETLEAKGDMK